MIVISDFSSPVDVIVSVLLPVFGSATSEEIVALLNNVCPLVEIAALPVITIVPVVPIGKFKPVNVSVLPDSVPVTELERYTNPVGNISVIVPVAAFTPRLLYASVYTIVSPE